MFDSRTVEDYGAVGDGTTNDLAAAMAMNAEVGIIRLLDKPYFMQGGLLLTQEFVNIEGIRRPVPDATAATLVNGSVIIGTTFLRSKRARCLDFGVDVGSGRFAASQEGFVCDALIGTNGQFAELRSIASLGFPNAPASHAMLVEGFDDYLIEDAWVGNHQYGVVPKSRRGSVNRVVFYNIATAGVYAKSSLPAVAGNVLSGRVDDVYIEDVKGSSTSPNAVAAWVHSEGVANSRVSVNNLSMSGGRAILRISADPNASANVTAVKASGLIGDSSYIGFEVYGSTFDVEVTDVSVTNPTSGMAFSFDANTVNAHVSDVALVITQASITGNNPASMLGSGSWDNFSVRNAYRTMLINTDIGAWRTGKKRGNVQVWGEGNLTAAAGNTLGSNPAHVTVGHDSTVSCSGSVVIGASSPAAFATVTGSVSFGNSRFYPCVARKTDGTYTMAPVYASGQTLTVFPSASGLAEIDVSSIVIRRD